MCGICGRLNFDSQKDVPQGLLKAMADTIQHRGPDDEGFFVAGHIGLGFRRLSIIDLATGRQPLSNEDGTVWVVFNGEIYNHEELRRDLLTRGHVFKSRSDTEVIVHLYEELGEGCLERLRGMFALAIWDGRQRQLLLARDRVGIKPLYYWRSETSLVFGSEIKAILADPDVTSSVVPEMVDRFLTFHYVPGDETLLRGISKVPPGHYLIARDGQIKLRQYWDLTFAPRKRSMADVQDELMELLTEAVRLHMISDVPVGFLLSGGVDSTAVLSVAAGLTDQPLRSYTLGFESPGLVDERPYAALAASRFGSEHHETTISPQDFADFMPSFAWYMEEPVCEPQAVALFYVSRLARRDVKVLLSGEGGDEAFAGYQTYRGIQWLERLKSLLGPLLPLASLASDGLERLTHSPRLQKYGPLMKQSFGDSYYGRTYARTSYFNSSYAELYTADFRAYVDKAAAVAPVREHLKKTHGQHVIDRMLYVDTKTTLPDDLLLKADKMTMANSIELRVPLLDHKLLEFAATVPPDFKVRGLTTKYILKEALRQHVPQEILRRPKAGFPVPFDNWLRGPLKPWLQDVLLDRKTTARGYFDRRRVESLIARHVSGGGYSKELLSLAALELWHRSFASGDRLSADGHGDIAPTPGGLEAAPTTTSLRPA